MGTRGCCNKRYSEYKYHSPLVEVLGKTPHIYSTPLQMCGSGKLMLVSNEHCHGQVSHPGGDILSVTLRRRNFGNAYRVWNADHYFK